MVGAKKIVIKALPKGADLSPEMVLELLALVQSALIIIYAREQSQLKFAEIYDHIHKLIRNNCEDQLYAILLTLRPKVLEALTAAFSVPDPQLPETLGTLWKNDVMTRLNLTTFFRQMDNYINTKKLSSINEIILETYRSFLSNLEACIRLRKLMLEIVSRERQGEWAERDVVTQLGKMLVTIGINSRELYRDLFELKFLESTRNFYMQEAQEVLSASTCAEYLRHAKRRKQEELLRVQQCLDSSTELPLIAVFNECFIIPHYQQLIDMPSGCQKMFAENQVSDLRIMFSLFQLLPDAFSALQKALLKFIIDYVGSILSNVSASEISSRYHQLFSIRSQLRSIIKSSFNGNRAMEEVMILGFEKVCNNSGSISQQLAIFIDMLMVKDIKMMTDDAIEDVLDAVLAIFRYLQSKDVFEATNKALFAKRLLYGKSINDDAERSLIRKFKLECGAFYTQKIEGMVKDIESAKQEHVCVKEEGVEIEALVLKSVFWPSDNAITAKCPRGLETALSNLQARYLSIHPNRLVNWKTNYGTAVLQARLGTEEAKYELQVSTYQMFTLLLFNEVEVITYHDLVSVLGVQYEKEFPKHVFGLLASKVLEKSPPSKILEPDCQLKVSPTFKSKLLRIKVSVAAPKTKEKQVKASTEDGLPSEVIESRKFLTDSAIIRVMKSRKEMEHQLLVADVMKVLSDKFAADPRDIKQRIENLIEREYLERGDSMTLYRYVA